ncbi:ArnT family glycosyltransferase [Celeribacter sp.]|uniref:ArnT family glycosyltransferase n=1 Tax=Celeribacter sp. TaxID=1890673 RepID=UPI003A8D4100
MTQTPSARLSHPADTHRITRLFFVVITAYFLAQLALRLILGGALETDEAEMLLMTPGLRWGYGPQLPLYNWLQTVLFALFGETLFALSLLKNLLLWATYACLFLGLRAFVPARVAALTAVSLFLIPDIAWEAQRATTHSNMLLATISASFAAYLWALKTGQWRHWVLFGVALGLGGIAKYNFWAIPAGLLLATLSLAQTRRMLTRRALIAPLIALVIVAGPYLWMANNPDLSLSSVGKMDMSGDAKQIIPEGASLYIQGVLILTLLPALVAGVLWTFSRKTKAVLGSAEGSHIVTTLFLRTFVILGIAGLILVWLADVGHITPRWLLPIVLPLVIGVFLRLTPRMGRRSAIGYSATLAVLAVLVITGLSLDRYKEGARRDLDFAPLATQIEEMHLPQNTLIVADFYVGGNLARIRPNWIIRSDLPASARSETTEHILLISRSSKTDASLQELAVRVDWPHAGQASYASGQQIDLPFHHSERSQPLRLLLGTVDQ